MSESGEYLGRPAATVGGMLAPAPGPAREPDGLKTLVAAYERTLILSALRAARGHKRRAAASLGLLPTTLHEKMRRLGIRARAGPAPRATAARPIHASIRWTGTLAPGALIELRAFNGPIRVEREDRTETEVTVGRTGPAEAVRATAVKLVEHAGGLAVVAVCPLGDPDEPIPPPTVRIEMVAHVPLGVTVAASTVNGDVEIVGPAYGVEAIAVNGRVTRTSWPARAPGPWPAGSRPGDTSRA
jgi:hypothetical protein